MIVSSFFIDDDAVLCYVEDDVAYFTTQALSDQWGDDWNDAPYEHNAGCPYADQHGAERQYSIYKLRFDSMLYVPSYEHTNSPYSVQDINAGKVPWLRQGLTGKGDGDIHAGTTLKAFVAQMRRRGGAVFADVKVSE